MEYVYGDSLYQTLLKRGSAKEGNIKQGYVLDWGCQILKALAYIHSKGVVHGNIGLHNIILTKTATESGEIRLIDFRLKDDSDDEARPFDPGKKTTLDDIYDTGMVLFRMLTGTKFGDKMSSGEKREILCQNRVAEPVCDVICRAIESNPEKRYQTAEEMLRAVQSLYKNDNRTREILLRKIRVITAAALIFFAGFGFLGLGNRFITRTQTMDLLAASSIRALEQANYTEALTLALQATDTTSIFSPDATARAGNALSKAISACDLTAGYKPLHSNPHLQGNLVHIGLSPDGKYTVAMVENATSAGRFMIQIFDTANGEQVDTIGNDGQTVVNGTLSDFVITDENILIYATENAIAGYDLNDRREAWKGVSIPETFVPDDQPERQPPLSTPGGENGDIPENSTAYMAPVRIALSPDGGKAVALYVDERTVYIRNLAEGTERVIHLRENVPPPEAQHKEPSAEETIDMEPRAEQDSVNPNRAVPRPQELIDHLLAIDNDGSHLAVSFSDGSLYMYRLESNISTSIVLREEYPPGFPYNHYEGGFHDTSVHDEESGTDTVHHYFLYAASVISPPDTLNGNATEETSEERTPRAEARLYDVDKLDVKMASNEKAEYQLNRSLSQPMHTLIDETGIYLSDNDQIYHVLPDLGEYGNWGSQIDTRNGGVLFLRHAEGRILAVTENSAVLLYEERSESEVVTNELLDGLSFQDAAISEEYLVLSGGQRICVLQWQEQKPVISYPPDYRHNVARVLLDSDRQPLSVMLFSNNGFRIYDKDGALVHEESFNQWGMISEIKYLRKPESSSDPPGECLKVNYMDKVEYYSAKTGELIPGGTSGVWTDSGREMVVGAFHVKYQRKEGTTVYRGKNRLIASYPDELVCASEYQGQLLISLLSGTDYYIRSNAKNYSVLLDEVGNTLAEYPGTDCEVMPDGTLFADDHNGNILRESVWSVAELRESAQGRIISAQDGGHISE